MSPSNIEPTPHNHLEENMQALGNLPSITPNDDINSFTDRVNRHAEYNNIPQEEVLTTMKKQMIHSSFVQLARSTINRIQKKGNEIQYGDDD